jgi:tetratricopeptide (TPR) repeat protein
MTLNPYDSQLEAVRQSVSELLAAAEPLHWEKFVFHADKLAYAGDWALLTTLVKRLMKDGKAYSHAFIYLLAALKSARGKPGWSEIVEVAELLQQHGEWRLLNELFDVSSRDDLPPRAYELQLMALRGIDGHLSVLRHDDVVGDKYQGKGLAVAIQCAAICSEIGDFGSVLTIPEPLDSPTANELIDWEILKAWAYENSVRPDDAHKAASLFKEIHRRTEELVDSDIDGYQSPHPEARINIAGAQRSMTVVRKFWSKRGYADALSKLRPRGDQPLAEWSDFLSEALKLPEPVRSHPYVGRMVAWGYFQLRQFDSALSEYRNAIRDGYSKYRIQFEQALVLLHMGRVNASIDLYEKALADARDLNTFRRNALLRVALRQLFDDVHQSPELGNISQGYTIPEYFKHEIALALAELTESCPKAAARIEQDFGVMCNYLDEVWPRKDLDSNSSIDSIEWKTTRVVGFPDPGAAWYGLFLPIIEYRGSRFTCTETMLTEGSDERIVTLEPASEQMKSLNRGPAASPSTRILYLSESAIRTLIPLRSELPVELTKSFGATPSDVALCLDKTEALRLSEELAGRSIERAFRRYNKFLNSAKSGPVDKVKIERTRTEVQLAFHAGCTKNTVYQAKLLYLCLSELLEERPANLVRTADDEISRCLPSDDEFHELSAAFKEKALVASLEQSTLVGNATAVSQLADLIIKRGQAVSNITDNSKRTLHAEWAAAELQLICTNSKDALGLQEELKRVQKSSAIYLEKDLRTIALGLDAAFYRSIDFSAMNRPKLDVFAFYKGGKSLDKQSYKWLAVSS